MIVFEEEVLPTADYLQFMAQCLDVVMNDTSLVGVSAWNDNGQYCIICITVKKQSQYCGTVRTSMLYNNIVVGDRSLKLKAARCRRW